MALRDLLAQKASLAEEAIEEIISDYALYDPDEKTIVFAPAGASLQNRAKVMVYLVALQGWPFVTDEPIPVDAKPAEIGEHVGIHGGTLRPILKELKDRHVIAERGGRYFVRPMTLQAIRAELGNDKSGPAKPRRSRKRPAAAIRSSPMDAPSAEKKETRRSPGKKTGNLAARFEKWIDDGFFDTPKTLADVQKRFHKEGAIVPQTSVPKYLLKAIRSGRLAREEAEVNKKRVWTYHREG